MAVAFARASPPAPRPYQLSPTIVTDHKFAFISTGTTGTDITYYKLGSMFFCAQTAILAALPWDMVRIRSVEIWGTTAPCNVQVSFNGATVGALGDNSVHADASVGTAYIAHVKAKPKKSSQASQWQPCTINSNAINAFNINCSVAGCIVYVHVTFKCLDAIPQVSTGPTIAAATPGNYYFYALDQAAKAAALFPPLYVTNSL